MKKPFYRSKLDQSLITVDTEDQWLLKASTWTLCAAGLNGCVDGIHKSLTWFIIGPPKNLETDHINRNKLDNRRKNLRVVTSRANNLNNSGDNVYCNGRSFQVQVRNSGKRITKGGFRTYREASIFAKQLKQKILFEALEPTRKLNLHLTDLEYYQLV